jgi:hypothetical protein
MISRADHEVWIATFILQARYSGAHACLDADADVEGGGGADDAVVPHIMSMGFALKHAQARHRTTGRHRRLRLRFLISASTWSRGVQRVRDDVCKMMRVWRHLGVDVDAIDFNLHYWPFTYAENTHAKAIAVDGRWSSIGSINIQIRPNDAHPCSGNQGVCLDSRAVAARIIHYLLQFCNHHKCRQWHRDIRPRVFKGPSSHLTPGAVDSGGCTCTVFSRTRMGSARDLERYLLASAAHDGVDSDDSSRRGGDGSSSGV